MFAPLRVAPKSRPNETVHSSVAGHDPLAATVKVSPSISDPPIVMLKDDDSSELAQKLNSPSAGTFEVSATTGVAFTSANVNAANIERIFFKG